MPSLSRKTALVQELARITRRELIVIPMNEDTETSDIIGQWLPMTATDGKSSFRVQIREVIKQIMRSVVLLCTDRLGKNEDVRDALDKISRSFLHFDSAATSTSATSKHDLQNDLDVLANLRRSLDALMKNGVSWRVRYKLSAHDRKVEELEKRITEVLNREQDNGIAFSFVESEFVNAIKNGWWVLLDGVNSAPSEVVERLNSLLEEEPMLNLYEHAEGDVLTSKSGIHPDFRFFATANIYRKNSNKLSSAFLNRMVRVWLPRMDAELTVEKDVSKTDMMQLVKLQLGGVSGGLELSVVLLRFHQFLQKPKSVQDRIQFVSRFSLSFRCVQQTVRTMLFLLREGWSPVKALVRSIVRNYMSAAGTAAATHQMRLILADELRRSDILHAVEGGYSILPPSPQTMTEKHHAEASETISLMCTLEEKVSCLIDSVLSELTKNAATIHNEAIGFVVSALENVSQRRCPTSKAISATLEDAKQKAQTMQDIGKWITSNVPDVLGRNSLLADLPLLMREVTLGTKEIRNSVFQYLERASFQDVHDRAATVVRVRSVLLQLTQVLQFSGGLCTVSSKDGQLRALLRGAAAAVSHLELVVGTALAWTDAMKPTKLQHLRQVFDHSLEEQKDRAAKHAFQMQQTLRIIGPPASWPTLSSLVQKLVAMSGCKYQDLMPYCTMLQWQGLQWEFTLNPACRTVAIPPPGIDFLSPDNISLLEELHCNSVVKKRCRTLIDNLDDPLRACVRSWETLEAQMVAHRKEVGDKRKKLMTTRQSVESKKGRIEQMESEQHDHYSEAQDLKRAIVQMQNTNLAEGKPEASGAVKEKQEDLQRILKKLQDVTRQVDRETIAVGLKEEEIDLQEIKLENENALAVSSFEQEQMQVLGLLQGKMDAAGDALSKLKGSRCFKFLVNMHVTPGLAAAQSFLEQVQALISRVASSGQPVCPSSLEYGFAQLMKSCPRLLGSPIGGMLIGTFLVPNAHDTSNTFLRQGMSIVGTSDALAPEMIPPVLQAAGTHVFFICGARDHEDALSLCVLDTGKREGAQRLEVHHWHSHGDGSKAHQGWVDALVQSIRGMGLAVSEHSQSFPADSLVTEDDLVSACVSALHCVQTDLTNCLVIEPTSADIDIIGKGFEDAKGRMRRMVSVNSEKSDTVANLELVGTEFYKVECLLSLDWPQQLEAWAKSEKVVKLLQEYLKTLMCSNPVGSFSELSCDECSKKLEAKLALLKVDTSVDRYRALQRIRTLKKSQNFTVLSEVEKRLLTSDGVDDAAVEFEGCDKALQSVRKVIFVFERPAQVHAGQSSFSSACIDASQAALTLCRELSVHVTMCIDCSSGALRIRQLPTKKLLDDLSAKSCQLLKDLGFPETSAAATDIPGTITSIFVKLQQRRVDGPEATLNQDAQEAETASDAELLADDHMKKLEAQILVVRGITPVRYEVLNNIRTFMNELKAAKSSKCKLADVESLIQKRKGPINREIARIKLKDKIKESAWLCDFETNGLEVVDLHHGSDRPEFKQTPESVKHVTEAYELLTGMMEKIHTDNRLESAQLHVSTSAKMRCWQQLLKICRLLEGEHSVENMGRLYLLSDIVSEAVATDLNKAQLQMNSSQKDVPTHTPSFVQSILPIIIHEYAAFRQDLFDKMIDKNKPGEKAKDEIQQKIFDFSLVRDICAPASKDLTAATSFGKLLPTMKSILTRSNCV